MGLEFVPTPQSATMIRKIGLLMRNTKNGIHVFYDQTMIEPLQLHAADKNDPLCFGFKVFSKDRSFQNYTDPPVYQEESILYFDNRKTKKDKTGRLRLHDAGYVSNQDYEPLDSSLLKDVLSPRDRLVRPHFVVNIWLGRNRKLFDKQNNTTAKHYYLRFNARETVWKYYVLGEIAQKNPYIADLNDKTEFESGGQAILPGNRTAITFRSKKPIPLREKYDHRFQLKTNGSNGSKVLIKRLPVAAVNHIHRETIKGKEAVVSEMFINC